MMLGGNGGGNREREEMVVYGGKGVELGVE